VGYPELLRVLADEAAHEAEAVRAAAERERARILAEARATAQAARTSIAVAEHDAAEAQRRTALDGVAAERDRALLVERRRLLDAAQDEARARLPSPAAAAIDARLLAELLPEVGDGPIEVVVDPGAEEAARAVLASLAPAVAARARVIAAPSARGGIAVLAGRRVLDDTLPARLARAWDALEPELAALLFREG
jgi:V/A-type H+-transporting ATPase subunit E